MANAALDHVTRLIDLGRVDARAQIVANDLPTREFIAQRVERAPWESEVIALLGCRGGHIARCILGILIEFHAI